MNALPLQWLENFLLDYNVAHAVLVLFVLSVLGTLPLKSVKLSALTTAVFGLVFALIPSQMAPILWRFLGMGLVIVATLLYIVSDE